MPAAADNFTTADGINAALALLAFALAAFGLWLQRRDRRADKREREREQETRCEVEVALVEQLEPVLGRRTERLVRVNLVN